MKQTPKGWPRLSSALYYDDAAKAIDWLCQAFGFVVRLKVEGDGGRIEHSELTYGDALIMVAQSGAAKPGREHFPRGVSPRSVGGGNTQCILLFADNVDEHCAHARANGAVILAEPEDQDYGEEYWADRSYAAADIEGHMWWITQRIRDEREK